MAYLGNISKQAVSSKFNRRVEGSMRVLDRFYVALARNVRSWEG